MLKHKVRDANGKKPSRHSNSNHGDEYDKHGNVKGGSGRGSSHSRSGAAEDRSGGGDSIKR